MIRKSFAADCKSICANRTWALTYFNRGLVFPSLHKGIFPFFKSFELFQVTSLWRLRKYSINWRAKCSFKINRGFYIPLTITFSIEDPIMYTEIWIFDILYKVSNGFRPNKKTNRLWFRKHFVPLIQKGKVQVAFKSTIYFLIML